MLSNHCHENDEFYLMQQRIEARRFSAELEEEKIRMQIKLLEMDIEANEAMIKRARRDDTTSLVMVFLTGLVVGIFAYFLYMNLGL